MNRVAIQGARISFGPPACAARRLRVTTKLRFTVYRSLFTLFLLACDPTLPPLRGQIEIGQDPYAIFVAGGRNSDLYAVRGEGGAVVPVTFSSIAELGPALAPDGVQVAFLRGTSLEDSTPATVWLMNLLSGGERELPLPKGAGPPERVGWEKGGRAVIVSTANELYRINAPPEPSQTRLISGTERPAAESSLAVLLGNPVFTRVVPCQSSGDLCVAGKDGAPALLASGARDPLRWGPDSVAFFVGDEVEIRPLARGRPRRLAWSNVPARPREMTFFQGKREK